MAQTKHKIQALLSSAGSEPRHRFGQNFMIDQNLVRIVAEAGELGTDDTVIEVGPGTGTLTEELLERAGRVIAVEIDRDLAAMLRERFASITKFQLIEGDALSSKHALNAALLSNIRGVGAPPTHSLAPNDAWARRRRHNSRCKLVANLPYNIASPLVIELLIAGVDLLAFTVQKEVADRLRAQADSDAYGPLTVMAQLLSDVEVLRTLPPQAFWPAPKIDSALVRMRRNDRLGAIARDFSRFVHSVFSARRKTLRKALSNAGYEAQDVLTELAIDPQLRPENLPPATFLALYRKLRPESQPAADSR
jgi:16S rRNA (adenine1518-N6/adenine1519-N6)-dimethyltransferase